MPDRTAKEQEPGARAAGSRFRPGESGNPARPKGARNKSAALCADLLDADAGAILATLVKRAKRGDGVALKLCVERLYPLRAARDRVLDLDAPQLARAQDLAAAAAEVVGLAAAGALTLPEAGEFMALLERQRRLIETAELAVRLEALEAAVVPRPAVVIDAARVRSILGGKR